MSFETKAIGIIVSIAFVLTSLSLLSVGLLCTFTSSLPMEPQKCENIYVSGLMLTFIVGAFGLFALIVYIWDKLLDEKKPEIQAKTHPKTHAVRKYTSKVFST